MRLERGSRSGMGGNWGFRRSLQEGIVENITTIANIGGEGSSGLLQNEPPPSPTSSPIVDMDVSLPFQVKIEPGTIKQEEEDDSTFVIVDSTSLAPLLPPSPVSPSLLDDPEEPNVPAPDNNDVAANGEGQLSPPHPPPDNPVDTLINELIPDIPSQSQATPKITKRMESWLVEHGLHSSKDLTCLCGKFFTSEGILNEHIRRYTKAYKFACPICFDTVFNCLRRFRGLHDLKVHLANIHTAQLDSYQQVGCRDCGDMSSSQTAFKRHKCQEKISSSDNNPDQDDDRDDNPPREPIIHGEAPQVIMEPYQAFLCYCGKQVDSQQELLEHIEQVTSDLKYPCGRRDCGELFRDKDDLERHRAREHKQNSIMKFFKSVATPPRQNAPEEPTSSTGSPGAPQPSHPNPASPTSQSPQVSRGMKRAAPIENRSLSVGSSPSLPSQGLSSSLSTPKRPRFNYPARRASQNIMKASRPGTGPPSPPISHESIHE